MKRVLTVLAAVLLVVFTCLSVSALAESEHNLLPNAGFEFLDGDGMPSGWRTNAYRNQPGYSRLISTDEKAHTGSRSLLIENASSNDARFICTVSVEPETLYRLSGYVLVEGMEDIGNGANFAIEDLYSYSDCLFDTGNEWQYLEWYGETGEDQTSLTLGVRVGGYSAESIGKAYFDDLVLEKVDALPEHVIASVWYRDIPVQNQTTVSSAETKSTLLFVGFAILFGLLFVFISKNSAVISKQKTGGVFLALLAVALIVRIIIAIRVPGYEVDINCFSAWSLRMAQVGPRGFYTEGYFCDYPPGSLLLLWPIGAILGNVSSEAAALLTVKFIPIVCDLLGAIFLYRFAQKKLSASNTLGLALLYLFNPAVLVNGSAWGQVDSLLALLVLFTTISAVSRDWKKAIPLFVISALGKPQALLFAPIGGMWLLYGLLDRNASSEQKAAEGRGILRGALYALAAALIVVVPFSVKQANPFLWLFELYGQTLSSYSYATLNAANLYYLADANWASLTESVPVLLSVGTGLLLTAVGLCLQTGKVIKLPSQCKAHAVLFLACGAGSLILTVFGTDYALFGYLMMAFSYLLALVCLWTNRKQAGVLPFCMALALIGVYVLGVKVHERYLFPALLLLLLSYALSKDRRVLILCVGFSITTFLNTAVVLENSIRYGASMGHLNKDTEFLNLLLSVSNLLLTGFAGWIGMTGVREEKVISKVSKFSSKPKEKSAPADGYTRMLLNPQDAKLHLTIRDYVIMGSVVVLYSILTFVNLGSTVAPQTAWISTSADEQVVLDLGEEQTFSVMYYGGVNYNDFSISVSSDGENWDDETLCQMNEGLCFKWNNVHSYTEVPGRGVTYHTDAPSSRLTFSGRYLRVNARQPGLNLWEIVARSEDGENIPLTLVSHTGARADLLDTPAPADNLIDEMDTCIGEPSWFNSMYFDEIYHAREAYHNLHGERSYEWTHPPLGKLLISAGIGIFGMTPFGWRFAGALIGVLMLPALYLLALQLTHKRSVAVTSMGAFALDLMHFTQTRIATIDSFPLIFILLSYLLMVRYMQTDLFALAEGEKPRLWTGAFRRSLLTLACCGFLMGLSIASKWTGAYAAIGLAVLFFVTIFRQYRASILAFEHKEQQNRMQNAQNYTIHRIFITCGFCVLFFVIIPLLIYAASYIPMLAPEGNVTLGRIIQLQESMLSYHGAPGFGSDHPFQSPWWQWPFLLKPMWYVQDQFEPAGFASTILCFGNPWVFYLGACCMAAVLLMFVMKYLGFSNRRLVLKKGNGDLSLVVISIGFLAQYLPWVIVPRGTYMYHYFASVPFIILATAWIPEQLPHCNRKLRYGVMAGYLIGAAVFFVLYFPYASGVMTDTAWLDAVKGFLKLYY